MLSNLLFMASSVSFLTCLSVLSSPHAVVQSCLRQRPSEAWYLQSTHITMNFGEQRLIIVFNLSSSSSSSQPTHLPQPSATLISDEQHTPKTAQQHLASVLMFSGMETELCVKWVQKCIWHRIWCIREARAERSSTEQTITQMHFGNLWEWKGVTGHVDELIRCHVLWEGRSDIYS